VTRALRGGLIALGLPPVLAGGWGLLAPESWYEGFPGGGRSWLPPLGPFNEHLARDFGAAQLALGLLLLWAAVSLARALVVPLLVAWTVFAVAHLAFHLGHTEPYGTVDDVLNLAGLALVVLVPGALLALTLTLPPSSTQGDRPHVDRPAAVRR
jgi:hypothetical protein